MLVTGGSGFVASYCIAALLCEGYRVRTTVRSLSREPLVREMLAQAGLPSSDGLSFATADLLSDAGWDQAVNGCDYVLHVASPFPAGVPKHENDLIIPARDGALRVLRAAREAGVRRVVLTSSFAAIGYGHAANRQTPFTEADWTDPAAHISAYTKSKTLSERAAWDFIRNEGGVLELAVINPVGVFGPVLGPDYSSSIGLLKRMLDGGVPGCPNLWFGSVDVRDVADLHVRAMISPAANGERFLAVAGDFLSVYDIAQILRRRLGDAAAKVPSRRIPDVLVRIASLFDTAVRDTLPELGKKKNATSAKAIQRLGWQPRSSEEAIIATAESLLTLQAAGTIRPPRS
ncbi:MAG: SDR family oxidoreductase [Gemmatimonas sp.]